MSTRVDEKRIYQAVGVQLRSEQVNGAKFLHGRAVPYDDPTDIGWYLEEHAPGSLAKSIAESARALPLLLFHQDTVFPIGVADKWNDNTAGLDGIWKLDTEDPLAMEAARKAEEEVLGFMSIRFQPIKSEWTFVEDLRPELGSKDTVRRVESRLIEVSLVSTPAFKNATVEFVRTAERQREGAEPAPKLKAWRAELDKIRG